MRKRILFLISLFTIAPAALAMTRDAQLTNTTGYNYNYMYPYMNNAMRTNLNPGVTTSQSLSPINTVVKTTALPNTTARRVVPRRTSNARTATPQSAPTALNNSRRVISRGASGAASRRTIPTATTPGARRVVARSAMAPGATMRGTSNREQNTYLYRTSSNAAAMATESTTPRVTSGRCLADYTACMNNYCERPNTAYNRCYCSSKLSQIDSQYMSNIESLINQILTMKSTNRWTDEEMNEYWMSTVGKYRGENSWVNLDNALTIDWSSTESRVRGQTAFTTGHEYCIQHLRGCAYMISNLRDAYRSEIARDCATYESSLQRIKNAAESILGANK